MNLIKVDKFLPRVLPYAENLPELVARRAISDACRELMEEALNIEMPYKFTTKEGEAKYTIKPPYRMNCTKVRSGTIKRPDDTGRWQITQTTAEVLDTYSYPISWRDTHGAPVVYLFRAPDEIILAPVPDGEFEVELQCCVTIRRDALEVPEILYEDYADVVVNGALGKALSMAGQTWTDANLGGAYNQAFKAGVNKARLEASKDFTKVGGRVTYNRWI